MKADAETLTKALDWVNRRLQEDPNSDKVQAIEEASLKFNLSPLDADWLFSQVKKPSS
jgi:hypothetical protein